MKTHIRKDTLSGLDVLIYTSPHADRLVFLQHGIRSKKENPMHLLAVSLVRLGYEVVAIDAYKHGSRLEEPFASGDPDLCELDTMTVVAQTAQDLVDLYTQHFQARFRTFDVLGISMGGLIAYYLATLTDRIDTLIALISSPRFLEAAEHTFPPDKQARYPEAAKKSRAHVKRLDPSTNADTMHYRRLIMLNGAEDSVIPAEQSARFMHENLHRNIIFKTFPTAHKISVDMHETLLALLKV